MDNQTEDDFVAKARIAILGLGLMGGSLALALKGRCARLLGVDPNPQTMKLARQMHLCDDISTDPGEILPQADTLILAAPARSIITLIHRLPHLAPGPAVVIDLGSTKREIWSALAALPGRFDPIGGHPMCGKEKGTLENADPEMFKGAPFALTPLPQTSTQASAFAMQLVRAIGSHPIWIDPETHDAWVAATSHLPYLTSVGLALATPVDTAPLAGPGLRSTTRLAASDPAMMMDILITNREEILKALVRYRNCLDEIESALETEDFSSLQQLMATARERRAVLGGLAVESDIVK